MKYVTIAAILLFVFIGCHKKEDTSTCTYQCSEVSPGLYFPDRTASELKQITISTYEAGSNFSKLISKNNYTEFDTVTDNGTRYTNRFKDVQLGSQYDYKIEMPDTTSYLISNITPKEKTLSLGCGKQYACTFTPDSCTVNEKRVRFTFSYYYTCALSLTK